MSLALLLNYKAGAQTSEIDSLLEEVKDASFYDSARVFSIGEKAISLAKRNDNQSALALIYLYYGNYFFYVQNLNRAEYYFNLSKQKAAIAKDQSISLLASIRLAYLKSELGLEEMALDQLNSFLIIAKNRKDYKNQAEAINLIANIKVNEGDTKNAIKLYYEGLVLAEKYNLKYYYSVFRNNLGVLKMNSGNDSAAYRDFIEGLKIAQEEKELRIANDIRIGLCILEVKWNKELKGTELFEHVLNYYKDNNLPQELSYCYINLASTYLNKKDGQAALVYYDSAIHILDKYKLSEDLNNAKLRKSNALFQLGKIDMSYQLIVSLDKYFANKNDLNSSFYYFQLYQIYERKGEYKKALNNLIKHNELKKAVEEKLNSKVIEELQQNYKVQQKEIELEKEKTKTILLEKENQEHRFVLWFSISLAGLIIILIGVFFYIKYTRRIKEEQQLFSQQLISNIEEERKRIARDLHDDIGQSLSFIKSKIVNEKSKNSELILSLEKELGAVIEQTREISHGLYPSSLEKIGLARSVAALMTAVQNSTNLECSFDIADEVQQLSILVQTHLFRILQECVNNTLKHSNASGLKISIEKKGNEFTLTYQDNGKSAKNKKKMDGIGLLSIKERANIIGAMIHANDITEKGFKLVLKFK
jgi:two-component system NarL family sensor kinase